MKLFINTDDAYSAKIRLPLNYVFFYENLRAYYATLSLLLLIKVRVTGLDWRNTNVKYKALALTFRKL